MDTTIGTYILIIWLYVVLAGLEPRILVQIAVSLRCTSWRCAVDTPETPRGVWRNILKINFASSSFFFKCVYRDARSTKHKIYCAVCGFSQTSAVPQVVCGDNTNIRPWPLLSKIGTATKISIKFIRKCLFCYFFRFTRRLWRRFLHN